MSPRRTAALAVITRPNYPRTAELETLMALFKPRWKNQGCGVNYQTEAVPNRPPHLPTTCRLPRQYA